MSQVKLAELMKIEISPIIGFPLIAIFVAIVLMLIWRLENSTRRIPDDLKLHSKPEGIKWEDCPIAPEILGETHKIALFKYSKSESGVFIWRKSIFRGNDWYFFDNERFLFDFKQNGQIQVKINRSR